MGGMVVARKQKRMSAQVVEDEDYQLRYEIAAGIDVAKESSTALRSAGSLLIARNFVFSSTRRTRGPTRSRTS